MMTQFEDKSMEVQASMISLAKDQGNKPAQLFEKPLQALPIYGKMKLV